MRQAGWMLMFVVVATQGLSFACADAAREGDEANAIVDETPRHSIIPQRTPAFFVEGDRSDLSLSASGNVALVEAHYLPTGPLTPGAWLTIGAAGRPSQVLSGRFRFQRYRDLLVDLFAQSHAPLGVNARARLDECTLGLPDTLSTYGLAAHWERTASAWGGAFPESFVPTLRALRGGSREPLGHALVNDAVRALAAEAISYASVIDRMRVFRIFSRTSGLVDDPAFVRAWTSAEERIKRRRALTVVATADLLRIRAPAEGTLLAAVRLPIVPARIVKDLFPDVPDSLVERIGFDRRWRSGAVTTVREVQGVDATLVLYATLEHALFTGVTPEAGCGDGRGLATDRDAVVAVALRRYLGFRYAVVVAELLRSAPALAVAAWTDHAPDLTEVDVETSLASARALGQRLDEAMAACDR